MASKKPAKQNKVKPNLNKPAPKPVVHLDYLRVYHEVLKHEDVLDIELDDIFAATMRVLEDNLAKSKLSKEPDGLGVEILVSKVMEELVDKTESEEEENPLLKIVSRELVTFTDGRDRMRLRDISATLRCEA